MIQRFQSLLLFLIAIIMILMSFFPIWGAISADTTKVAMLWAYKITFEDAGQTSNPFNPIVIIVLASLAAVVALVSIFMYRNRMRQIQLGMLNSILIGGTMLAAVFYVKKGWELFGDAQVAGGYKSAFWMPIVALLLNMVANRFIRRDERTVRDSNRLR